MRLRQATSSDRTAILQVHTSAFGQDEESLLVESLLADRSAEPLLSLLAEQSGRVVGHALFTSVKLLGPEQPPNASILAPLAVTPAAQGLGVGRRLIEEGCNLLAQRRQQLLFVLGDPNYYNKRGFTAALPHGFQAPYKIVPESAWMVRALGDMTLGGIEAKVRCADALAPEKYWRE